MIWPKKVSEFHFHIWYCKSKQKGGKCCFFEGQAKVLIYNQNWNLGQLYLYMEFDMFSSTRLIVL
jgi:hypothetical protein